MFWTVPQAQATVRATSEKSWATMRVKPPASLISATAMRDREAERVAVG